MVFKLYSYPNSYSMTAQVALEEVGADYELVWTTIHIPLSEKDPALLAANPNGRARGTALRVGRDPGAPRGTLPAGRPDARP